MTTQLGPWIAASMGVRKNARLSTAMDRVYKAIQSNYYPFLSGNLPLRELRAHLGRDDRAQKLDRAQDRVLRLGADRHLHESAVVAKDLVLSE